MLDSAIDINDKKPNISIRKKRGIIDKRICCNIKNIEFQKRYDLIYVIWGLAYLTDNDCQNLLIKVHRAL
jgi:hypothetical protein